MSIKSHLRVSQLSTSVHQPRSHYTACFQMHFLHISPFISLLYMGWRTKSEGELLSTSRPWACQDCTAKLLFFLSLFLWGKIHWNAPSPFWSISFFQLYTMTCHSNALGTNFYNWLQQDRFLEITFIFLN